MFYKRGKYDCTQEVMRASLSIHIEKLRETGNLVFQKHDKYEHVIIY